MRYIEYKGRKICHGDNISGSIKGVEVHGSLSIEESDADDSGKSKRAYFCQNKKTGSYVNEKFRYKYSWIFSVLDNGRLSADVEIYVDGETSGSSKEITNPKKTIMSEETSSVVEFAKSLLLSKEEKLLREAGLKDSCGEYTPEAKELIMNKLVRENEEYLIDIAKKMEDETKPKK